MNDPWHSLIQTLAGADQVTPGWWPDRRVYRMFDQPDAAPVDNERKVTRAPKKRQTRAAATPLPAAPIDMPPQRLKCPCTNCTMQSKNGAA